MARRSVLPSGRTSRRRCLGDGFIDASNHHPPGAGANRFVTKIDPLQVA
jgi:hypothetical protein